MPESCRAEITLNHKYAALRARLEKLRSRPLGGVPFTAFDETQDILKTLLELIDVVQEDLSSMDERLREIEASRT